VCGIAGIIRWAPPEERPGEIADMTAALAHRGPDGHGSYARQGVALGHRRLSIIDPAGGRQPMSNEDGSVWVTFNGEIYNFRELRQDLEARGHRFASHCDTEVIVHGYEEWGARCVEKFRGMFALGVADFARRRVFLARDHLGIKPLYYRVGPTWLAFASELAALHRVAAPPARGSLQAMDYYLRFGYVPTPDTIFHDIFKLPPAHHMFVDFDGTRTAPERYWDLQFGTGETLSDAAWEDRLEQTLTAAVKAHLVADVPFGVFLSGGIDSTLVALEMSRLLERPVQAFAIGFEEQDYSELQYARQAAQACGIDLHTEVVRGAALDFLPDLLAHYGEPFGDASAIPTWHVCRLARQHVPMVLSGDGGDEAFAGYGRYDVWMKHGFPWALRQMLFSPGGLTAAAGALAQRVFQPARCASATWQAQMTYFNTGTRRALWRPEFRHLAAAPSGLFNQAAQGAPATDRLGYAQYIDIQTYLPCDILTKVDVASMYHGLEVRTPLVDHQVFELAARLPPHLRRRRTGWRTALLKYLPKRLLLRKFPADFVHRPKMGFGLPLAPWLRPGGPVRQLLAEAVLAPHARIQRFINPQTLNHMVARHDAGQDNQYALWVLVALGVWLEQHPQLTFAE